jgi:hypothetical protein
LIKKDKYKDAFFSPHLFICCLQVYYASITEAAYCAFDVYGLYRIYKISIKIGYIYILSKICQYKTFLETF